MTPKCKSNQNPSPFPPFFWLEVVTVFFCCLKFIEKKNENEVLVVVDIMIMRDLEYKFVSYPFIVVIALDCRIWIDGILILALICRCVGLFAGHSERSVTYKLINQGPNSLMEKHML
jgi:hypothetical protein